MKTVLIITALLVYTSATAQEIVGKWQLVKESTCAEGDLEPSSDEEEEIVGRMKSMSGPAPQTIEFKENNSVVESTRIVNRRRSHSPASMMYKFTGNSLHFLDRKSRTIIDTYSVEQLSADSLIISNSRRACETRIFIKIK